MAVENLTRVIMAIIDDEETCTRVAQGRLDDIDGADGLTHDERTLVTDVAREELPEVTAYAAWDSAQIEAAFPHHARVTRYIETGLQDQGLRARYFDWKNEQFGVVMPIP